MSALNGSGGTHLAVRVVLASAKGQQCPEGACGPWALCSHLGLTHVAGMGRKIGQVGLIIINENGGLADELKRAFSYVFLQDTEPPRHFSMYYKRTGTSPLWDSWYPAFVNAADSASSDV